MGSSSSCSISITLTILRAPITIAGSVPWRLARIISRWQFARANSNLMPEDIYDAASAMTTHRDLIPDFMAENDRTIGDAVQRSVRAALTAGIPIAMGTDADVPFVMHGDNAVELVWMV